MRLGYVLPHLCPYAGPDSVTLVAQRAEELGFEALGDRAEPVPLDPTTPYPLGPLPDVYKTVLDPLDTLRFVAARTSRIGLGMAILNPRGTAPRSWPGG